MSREAKIAVAVAASVAFDILFSDFDSENEENSKNSNSTYFCEILVPQMSDKQFQNHFRLKPESFQILLEMLHHEVNHKIQSGRPAISIEKEAMIMLWYLANLESLQSVADRFCVSKSTCWNALYRSCNLLLKVNQNRKIICWPSYERTLQHQNGIQQQYNFLGVIGIIDGSHIPIIAPHEYHTSYINRKGFHSILLQVVCDTNLTFIDVYTGQPGSMHDWSMFKKSDLYRRITNNEITFPNNGHIIGDLAYTLTDYLIVGFKDYGNLTPRQQNFNIILSKIRAYVENSLALLKGRFRRLKLLETIRMDLIPLLILSACVLHNICIINKDVLQQFFNIEAEVERERYANAENLAENLARRMNNNAVMKRRNIVNMLPLMRRPH